METYLATTVLKLKSGKYSNLTIVLGNESCDLDSAVCALVYGAFLFWQHAQIKCKVCTRTSRDEASYQDDIFVPILNVDRDDYELKTEVMFVLKQHHITDNKLLIFRNDFDLEQLTAKQNTKVILVDHHVLAQRDRFLTNFVTEVIDHRPLVNRDEWMYNQDTRSNIELVGSCCSLVTQRIRSLGTLLSKEVDFFVHYRTATDMLLCGIILDTVNFSKEVNKTTAVDVEQAVFLESILKPAGGEEERKSKLESLIAARTDVSHLTPDQLLKKDVKILGEVMVPSFPILVKEWIVQQGATAAVVAALRRLQCSIAVLLGMSLREGLTRDVAIFADVHNRAVQSLVAKHFQEWKGPDLQLVPLEIPNKNEYIYFQQNNLSASRKQYMPIISNFLEIHKDIKNLKIS